MEERFLEDLLWTSYRYCIGRHSYVSTLASDMANYFYDKIDDTRKENIAQDIRRTIADSLQFRPFNISFDWTIPISERKPMELLLDFLSKLSDKYDNEEKRNELIQSELNLIESIEFSKDDTTKVIQYNVSKTTKPKFEHTIYEHELADYLPWMDLASLFDVSNHKIATIIDSKGNEAEYEVYESYINDSNVIEEKDNYLTLQAIPWKYKKIYRIVDKGISNCYLDNKTIKEIKNKK